MSDLSKAAEDVLAERRRQVLKEGWTAEHDDQWGRSELARAAAFYAITSLRSDSNKWVIEADVAAIWPFDFKWLKCSTDPRRDLVKAGALIIAEIERLDRAAKRSQGGEDE